MNLQFPPYLIYLTIIGLLFDFYCINFWIHFLISYLIQHSITDLMHFLIAYLLHYFKIVQVLCPLNQLFNYKSESNK